VTSPARNAIAFSPTFGKTLGTDPAGRFTIEQLDTGVTTHLATVGSPTDMHEFLPLANGNVVVLSYPITGDVDLSSRGIAGTDIADCNVQEIAPDGHLAWSWLGSEHLDAAKESTDLVQVVVDGETVTDPFHCNSVEVATNGDFMVSSRHTDSVFMISHATGKVLWKLGGVPFNKDGAQLVTLQGDSEGGFLHQHDARLLADGSISLFDDHQTANAPARGMELVLDLAGSTAKTTWQYATTTNSGAMGSYRRYADGSRVIGWGVLASSTAALTEVDERGQVLREISFPAGDHAYRAVKVAPDALDLAVLRRTAGGS
jgi:hypothetical protein